MKTALLETGRVATIAETPIVDRAQDRRVPAGSELSAPSLRRGTALAQGLRAWNHGVSPCSGLHRQGSSFRSSEDGAMSRLATRFPPRS